MAALTSSPSCCILTSSSPMTERLKMSFLAHPWPEALGTRSRGFLPSQGWAVGGMVEPSLSNCLAQEGELSSAWGGGFGLLELGFLSLPAAKCGWAGVQPLRLGCSSFLAPSLTSLLPGSHSGQHNLLLLQVLPLDQETWHHAGTRM